MCTRHTAICRGPGAVPTSGSTMFWRSDLQISAMVCLNWLGVSLAFLGSASWEATTLASTWRANRSAACAILEAESGRMPGLTPDTRRAASYRPRSASSTGKRWEEKQRRM